MHQDIGLYAGHVWVGAQRLDRRARERRGEAVERVMVDEMDRPPIRGDEAPRNPARVGRVIVEK